MPSKRIILEETVLIWIVSTVMVSIPILVVFAIFVEVIYGCWPIGAYSGKASSCLTQIQPPPLRFLPMALGILAGTILTIKIRREN